MTVDALVMRMGSVDCACWSVPANIQVSVVQGPAVPLSLKSGADRRVDDHVHVLAVGSKWNVSLNSPDVPAVVRYVFVIAIEPGVLLVKVTVPRVPEALSHFQTPNSAAALPKFWDDCCAFAAAAAAKEIVKRAARKAFANLTAR